MPLPDIVERLRHAADKRARGGKAWADYADAADEIVRLRAELEAKKAEIDDLWAHGVRRPAQPLTLDSMAVADTGVIITRYGEKQASRDQDAADLASGKKTREDLRRENGAFAFPRAMVHVGGKTILRKKG